MNSNNIRSINPHKSVFRLVNQEYIQLNQLLKVLGWVGTGGEAMMRIEEGEARLNGQKVLEKRKKIRPGDEVEFDGKIVSITT